MTQVETIYLWDKVAESTMKVPAAFYGEMRDIDRIVEARFENEHELLWWERILYLWRVRYRYTLTITDQ